ncbi:MAG: hypothetical protein EOP24_32455 [Hyphomicrobiales bacterium]|nr:MAG: hypothetical protein EOP24_32455 [Hyphomicrobiales bacterium]
MKLYELRANFDECCAFSFLYEDGGQVWTDLFDGTPHPQGYPVPLGHRRVDDEADGPLPDYTDFGLLYPTFSDRARHALDDLLTPNGEFAVIEMDEAMRYFAFNATTMVDVLDESRSAIAYFRSGGVMAVDKHVLLDSITSLPPIFRMPQTRRNTTYVSEAFVERAQQNGLLGFRFNLLFER